MNPQDNTPVPTYSAPQTQNTQDTSTGSPKLTGPVEMFYSSLSFYKKYWKLLAYIALVPSVAMLVSQLLFIYGDKSLIIVGFVLVAISIILSIAMQPALINAIHRFSTESSVSLNVNGQYRLGFKYFWTLILLIILQSLIVLGSSVLFVIPGIIVGLYVGMYLFALVVDGKKGFSSLTESYSLVRGRWWKVFGRILFVALVYIAIALILAGVGFVINMLFGFTSNSDGANIVSLLINLFSNVFLGPLMVVYIYKLYMLLKSTRSSGVTTEVFKKWLIAFVCIGVLTIIIGFIVVPIVATRIALSRAGDARVQIEQSMARAQAEIDKLSASSSVQIQ